MTAEVALKEAYLRDHPAEAAALLESMSDRSLRQHLRDVNAAVLVPCLDYLSSSRATALVEQLEPPQQQAVLTEAPPRLAMQLLAGMEDEEREAIMAALPESVRADLTRLQSFDRDSAGWLLDRPYDTIRDDMTVAEALAVLRQSGSRRTRFLYVVDRSNVLLGKVDMQTIAMADEDDVLRDLIEGLEGSVLATAPRREVVEQLEKYHVDSLPVVDVEGHLLGVVRYQKLLEAVESEATADIQRMVGVSADERALSPPGFSVRRRLPWLHINLLTAFLAAAVVGLFENLIAQFTALAILLPVVAGQSGNAGSQALAVTMRGLALKEIGTREWRAVLNKEIWVGLIDGIALAITCGVAVLVWSGSIGLAIVIGVAMILSMVAAGMSGALVPIILTRVGQDPATASSIILTTVTDVSGFVSFLGTATLLSFML